MPFNQWNKKQSIDIIDEDAKQLGILWLILKYLLPVIVGLILIVGAIYGLYWILKIAAYNGIIPPIYIP